MTPHLHVRKFQDFCDSFSIKLKFASMEHPQNTGQVELANNVILNK